MQQIWQICQSRTIEETVDPHATPAVGAGFHLCNPHLPLCQSSLTPSGVSGALTKGTMLILELHLNQSPTNNKARVTGLMARNNPNPQS